MFYGSGNTPVTSTQAEVVNPSTSDLLAEVISLDASAGGRARNYEVRAIVGASTFATFLIEQVTSSAIDGTNIRSGGDYLGQRTCYINGQSAQFMVRMRGEAGDRVRVRVKASIAAGNAAATLQVEPLV